MRSTYLHNFELADDLAFLAQLRSDMQSKLDDLADRSSASGLTINANKTKSLDVTTVNPSSFTVAGQALENVASFQYLGSQIATDGCNKIDMGLGLQHHHSISVTLQQQQQQRLDGYLCNFIPFRLEAG
ncbi:uncharacterized protein LOC134290390 [Aedes albopictus]|uniref:Reverse transcriptase domain-containing protein n=1 Tax=Aedes albopictus TaxID=7160 RepID=A0ABM1YEU6_AEDAL